MRFRRRPQGPLTPGPLSRPLLPGVASGSGSPHPTSIRWHRTHRKAGGPGLPQAGPPSSPWPLKMKLLRPRCQVMCSKPRRLVSTRRLSPRFQTRYTSLGHILDTRGTAGGGGSRRSPALFPQGPIPGPQEPSGRSPLTPAAELPLHLHVEVGGLRETRAPLRALPACSRGASPTGHPAPWRVSMCLCGPAHPPPQPNPAKQRVGHVRPKQVLRLSASAGLGARLKPTIYLLGGLRALLPPLGPRVFI